MARGLGLEVVDHPRQAGPDGVLVGNIILLNGLPRTPYRARVLAHEIGHMIARPDTVSEAGADSFAAALLRALGSPGRGRK